MRLGFVKENKLNNKSSFHSTATNNHALAFDATFQKPPYGYILLGLTHTYTK